MILRKLTLFMGIVVGLVLLSAQAGVASHDLVAFKRAKMAEARESSHVRVFAKLDTLAVGLIRPDNLSALKRIDPGATMLEAGTDIDLLWVAGDDSRIAEPGLIRTEHYRLLKLSYDQAQKLLAAGFHLSKCMDMDLPADPLFEIPLQIRPSRFMVADIDSLMALVSADSVRAYIQRMQDFQTRYTNTDSFWASSQWIEAMFRSWGYDSVEFENFSYYGWTSCNVIATKLGVVYPDRVIVIGGHFDSVVYDGGDPTVFAPGADDNASGTAMTMETARVLANTPFKKTVRFIAFGAEEQGLIGSQVYVYYALQRHENIELMINGDMIANLADSYLNFNVRCNVGGAPYGHVLENLASQYTNLIPQFQIGEYPGSDHYPFDQAGFRTVYSDEGDFSPNWHCRSDIIDNINCPYAADIIRSNLGLLLVSIAIPAPVTGLTVTNAGDGHTVYLDWQSSPDIDVVGYEVYVRQVVGGDTSIAVYDTSYVPMDTVYGVMEDSLYYYGVAGFTADGNRGLVEQFVPCVARGIPTRPDTLTIIPDFGQLLVQWTPTPDLDFDYYQLFRRVGVDGSFQPYRQITGDPQFVDQNLEANVRYYYYVVVYDTTGLASAPSVTDYSKILSLNSGILFVDETRRGNGSQGQPNEAQQDSFYQFISAEYPVTFHDTQEQGLLRINDLGAYSTVVWMDEDLTIHALADVDQDLARYLDVGGNVLFAGWCPLRSYDAFRPLDFHLGDFMNDYLGVNQVYASNNPDFVGASGSAGWPSLSVLPERVLPHLNGRLLAIDALSLNDSLTSIYTFNSVSGDTLLQGRTVGILFGCARYNFVYLSFPLYVMGDQAARDVFTNAMNIFGEQRQGIEDFLGNENPSWAILAQNYPNPFNVETNIRFRLPEDVKVHLAVFNILGQEVAVLADGEYTAGNHLVVWDGDGLPSGIYFCRLTTPRGSTSRRLTLLK